VVSAWLIAASAAAQAPMPPAPMPTPLPLFPADNWWNADISAAPVDPGSAAFINFIGTTRQVHPDFGGSDGSANGIYGIPYVVVPGSTPLEPVDFDAFGYPDESDVGAPGRPPGYPIPVGARTQAKWIEGGEPGGCNDSDCHMLLVDRDNRLLFELYQAFWNGSQWQAGSGAVFPLDTNLRRPDTWTSADAAGLAILPGLVRYDEVFGLDPIRHAFRMTVRSTNGYVFPASHEAGTTAGALPMGARLRLKAGTPNPTPANAALTKVYQAMKTYGLIVADNGSDMYITGAYDTQWDNGVLNPAFASLHASDFEVVQLGWKPPVASVTPALDFFSLAPCRILDTRLPSNQPPPGAHGGPALLPGERVLVAAGRCGIPATARAISVNITAVNPGALGNLRLFPGDGVAPNASALNFVAGGTRGNNALVMLASSGSGTFAIRNTSSAGVGVVIDVNGYFE
jgi:hypothetical protein